MSTRPDKSLLSHSSKWIIWYYKCHARDQQLRDPMPACKIPRFPSVRGSGMHGNVQPVIRCANFGRARVARANVTAPIIQMFFRVWANNSRPCPTHRKYYLIIYYFAKANLYRPKKTLILETLSTLVHLEKKCKGLRLYHMTDSIWLTSHFEYDWFNMTDLTFSMTDKTLKCT